MTFPETIGLLPAMMPQLPDDWRDELTDEIAKPYFQQLQDFIATEREHYAVYPPADEVFAAFAATPFKQMNVLFVGQEPYHDQGLSHGFCFSVRLGSEPTPSLMNIFKELQADIGIKPPNHGRLAEWAKQGVLLMNSVLTVRGGEANSHKNKGWETFTDAVIRRVNLRPDPVVFVLWGKYAQKKSRLVDADRHTLIEAAHPSPLSAKSGFFGSRPFSAINRALAKLGKPAIDWQL